MDKKRAAEEPFPFENEENKCKVQCTDNRNSDINITPNNLENCKRRLDENVAELQAEIEQLPRELLLLFAPLKCNLCSVNFENHIAASIHYQCKNHKKNVRKYLVKHAEETGKTLTSFISPQLQNCSKNEVDPRFSYCKFCDLKLTSKLHAESHYAGKKHNAVVMGKRAPSGKGFIDEEGKWNRLNEDLKKAAEQRGDNFGLTFGIQQNKVEAEPNPTLNQSPKPDFTCSLCNISCTCLDQINEHFNGAKHKKKMKNMNLALENFQVLENQNNVIDENAAAATTTVINEQSTPAKPPESSNFITPSGHFYCGKCNVYVNSESQLILHLSSKKHAKKTMKP